MFCSAQMIYAVINARFMVFQKNSYKQKGCYIVLYTYIKKIEKNPSDLPGMRNWAFK